MLHRLLKVSSLPLKALHEVLRRTFSLRARSLVSRHQNRSLTYLLLALHLRGDKNEAILTLGFVQELALHLFLILLARHILGLKRLVLVLVLCLLGLLFLATSLLVLVLSPSFLTKSRNVAVRIVSGVFAGGNVVSVHKATVVLDVAIRVFDWRVCDAGPIRRIFVHISRV